MLQHFDSAAFDQAIAGDKPVLVDFFATWCGPCRMIAPFIEELAEEYEGRAIVAKVDVDQNMDLAQRYRVMSIPYVAVFKAGKLVDQVIGACPKEELAALIDKCL